MVAAQLKWAALALIAAAIRLTVFFQLHAHPLLQAGDANDTDAYLQLADRVAGGDLLLGPGAYYISPLYVYFLALIRSATSSLDAIRIVQLGLGVCAVLLVADAARRLFGARAGLFAGLLAAGSSLFVFYEVLILQAAIDPVLTALDIWCLVRAVQSPRPREASLAGAAFGLHALNRPNMLIAGALVAAGWLAIDRARHARRRPLLFVAAMVVLVLPVTLRNYAVTGEPILLTSHGGLNLYIGNHPGADGTYTAVPGITPSILGQASDARSVVSRAIGRAAADSEVSTYFRDRALAWWIDQPGRALALFVRKLYYTFHAQFLTLNYSFPFYAHDERTLLGWLVGPAVLIPLGIAGLLWMLAIARRPDVRVVALTVPAIAVSVAVFFVAARYRLPMLVPLAIGGGAFVDALVRRVRGWQAAAAGFVLLAVAVNIPLGLYDARAGERLRHAVWAIRNQQPEKEAVARALDGHPVRDRAHLDLAKAYSDTGRTADAVSMLRSAPATAEIVDARHSMAAEFESRGVARARNGEDRAALSDLANAADLDPSSASIQLNLAVVLAQTGDVEGARVHALEALRLRPGYPQAEGLLRSLSR